MSDDPWVAQEGKREPVEFTVETIEHTYMGDHGERLRKSHTVIHGETVDELVRRVFPKLVTPFSQHDPTDEIIVRVINSETAPKDVVEF